MALNRVNMISMIFYFYLVFLSYIGATFIANGYGANPVLNLISMDARLFGWIVISYVMIAVPLGMLIAKVMFRIKNVEVLFNNYTFSALSPSLGKRDSHIKIFLYVLSFFSFLSIIYMIVTIGIIPQAQLFSMSSQSDVLLLRTSIDREFGGVYFIKSIFFEQLTPLLSFISYAYYRMTNSNKDRLWFYFMLGLTLFVLTFTLSKSPLVHYLIFFMLLKIYIDGRVQWKNFIKLAVIGTVLIFIMFLLVVRGADIDFIMNFLFERIFYNQISGAFLIFDIFPDIYPHIGLNSLSKPIANIFLGGHTETATRIAMVHSFPEATKLGIMNLLSTLFVAEAWANFGWFGIFISPFYVGFVIGSFYYFVLKRKKTPIMVGLLTFFSYGVNFASQFNQYLYNSTVFALIILIVSGYIFALMLKQTKMKVQKS